MTWTVLGTLLTILGVLALLVAGWWSLALLSVLGRILVAALVSLAILLVGLLLVTRPTVSLPVPEFPAMRLRTEPTMVGPIPFLVFAVVVLGATLGLGIRNRLDGGRLCGALITIAALLLLLYALAPVIFET